MRCVLSLVALQVPADNSVADPGFFYLPRDSLVIDVLHMEKTIVGQLLNGGVSVSCLCTAFLTRECSQGHMHCERHDCHW